VPIWVIVVAVIGGLVVLIALSAIGYLLFVKFHKPSNNWEKY
jgi:hypothetical protein